MSAEVPTGSNSQAEVAVHGPSNKLVLPDGFRIREVDGITVAKETASGIVFRAAAQDQKPLAPGPVLPLPAKKVVKGELGILSNLVGTFEGRGMNMIFRPNSGGQGVDDNLLEYNLTFETLAFMKDLGDIPNRGFQNQPDVFLRGVPYQQTIDDGLNPETGKADLKDKVSIHFEQGLFVRTPATVTPPVSAATISRMASIPHGTSINAQAVEPSGPPTQGTPTIDPISIFPFPLGNPANALDDTFPQTNPTVPARLRIPQDLARFEQTGALTKDIFLNPNKILTDFIGSTPTKKIVDHITFKVASKGTDALPAGGTSNIAFLQGANLTPEEAAQSPPPTKGNANAVSVTCQYWISTVAYDVVIPAGDWDKKPAKKLLKPEAAKVDKVFPKFLVELKKKISKDTTVKLTSKQIQYSQNVTLDFGNLSWPHISVANLLPQGALEVKADAAPLKDLK